MNKVELISSESDDWKVLKVNGTVKYEGHSVPDFIWLQVISNLGEIETIDREISDEDMENGDY